jgi:processive 1,2-diacylglycerol beta-glucosyltransferase
VRFAIVVGHRVGYRTPLPMTRILILTAGYGEGHNAAARGLAAAIAETGAEAEVRDLFLETYGRRQQFSQRLYIGCINRAAPLWALFYRGLDRTPLMRFIICTLGALRRRLGAVLQERQPPSVVSVYPVYGWLIDRLFPNGAPPFASHTVVTDSITVNSVWLRCRSDSWIVPNEATAEIVRDAGLPAQRVHALGFPVQPKFADSGIVRPPPGNGEPLRVLYMVNHGHAAAAGLVRQLIEVPAIRLTVTFGKDDALGRKLASVAKSAGREIELHGWTPRIAELVMNNHVLIGKAGGAATQEAIAARTPMIITKAVPGQEEGNARLIAENNCGAICETSDAIVETISRLTTGNAALWHRWHAAISTLSRPNAARDIARFILSFPPPPTQ